MRTSARLLATTGALVIAGLVVPATASATACSEAGRPDGPLTGPVHTADQLGEQTPAAPATEVVLHDTVEPLTCG